MSNAITFYTNPMSRGRIAHWMLEEIGAPYDVKLLDWNKAEHKAPAYLAVNPMGKVPAIVHRGVTITECGAICAYLADAFPKAGLAPALDDPLRGTYLRWFFFAAGCVEPAVIDKMLGREPAKPMAMAYGTFDAAIDALEKALTPGPYILGGKFTAVDLYVSSQIAFAFMTKTLEPKPLFQSYVDRCADRPAWQRFNDQSAKWDAELKAKA